MVTLKEVLAERIPALREEIRSLVKEHGDTKISDVTLKQAYGGMRGVKGLVCDTSLVTPEDGLIIRGIPILDLVDRTPEEAFYLLCVGELPSEADVQSIKDEFAQRSKVPDYLIDVLKAMPKTSHPMAMLTTGISALENESVFRARYDEGMKKEDYWEAALEDSLQLLAKLPSIAGAVSRIRLPP